MASIGPLTEEQIFIREGRCGDCGKYRCKCEENTTFFCNKCVGTHLSWEKECPQINLDTLARLRAQPKRRFYVG